MKIVKYDKYVGTMIGPEGYLHQWTAPRENSFKEPGKSTELPKVLLNDLLTSKCMPYQCLGYMRSISAADGATLKEEAHALQCTTAGPKKCCTY